MARLQPMRTLGIGQWMHTMQSPMRLLGVPGDMDNTVDLSEEEDDQGEVGSYNNRNSF